MLGIEGEFMFSEDVRHRRGFAMNIGIGMSVVHRIIRLAQGFSQRDLAERTGKKRNYFSKIENAYHWDGGAVSLYVVEEIAEWLGVTPYGLILMAEAVK